MWVLMRYAETVSPAIATWHGDFLVTQLSRHMADLYVQALAAVLLFVRDARGNVKPHALRLQHDASGTVLSPLLVVPTNLADAAGMAAESTSLRHNANDGQSRLEGNDDTAQREHGFWPANAAWSPDRSLAGNRHFKSSATLTVNGCSIDFVHAGAPGAEVQQVLLHRSSGILVMRWGPARPWALPADMAITALSAADALVAKQLLRMSVLACTETVHPSSLAHLSYAAMHTGLTFWGLQHGRCGSSMLLTLSGIPFLMC